MGPTGIGVGATGVLLWGLGAVPQWFVGVTAQIQWPVGPKGYRMVPNWGCCYGCWGLQHSICGVPLQIGNGQWGQWGIGVCATGGVAMGPRGSQPQFGQGNDQPDTRWAPNWELLQWVPRVRGWGQKPQRARPSGHPN